MGDEGRRFLEEHHRPEMYAEALIDFVADAQRFSPQAAAYELAIRWAQPCMVGVVCQRPVWSRICGTRRRIPPATEYRAASCNP